jgi:ABC-type phosphate/phosphonate transport system substrate-binding protein
VVQAVQEAFVAMAATEEGAAMLAEVPFVKLIPASAADYDTLRDLGLERYYISLTSPPD